MAAKMTYREQLLHPNWQKKRLHMLEASGWACLCCKATESTLHVHHKQYFKGRMAWEYSDDELEVLCELCHSERHEYDELLSRVLAGVQFDGLSPGMFAAGLLAGLAKGLNKIDDDLAEEVFRRSGPAFEFAFLASMLGIQRVVKAVRSTEFKTPNEMRDRILAEFKQEEPDA